MGSPVLTLKEQNPVTADPLLLAEFVFLDGSTLYLSTAPLNSTEGGYSYNGHNYLARISQQDIAAISQRSEQGIDRVPTVSLHLLDSDRLLWVNYETAAGKGFKGAILTLRFVFWSAATNSFSSNSYIPFPGICDAPSIEREGRGDVLVVTATANKNMAKAFLPVFHVQQRCGNVFPTTAAQRLAGATDMSASQWGCGYDPDQAGTDPEINGDARRGNLNSGVPFTTCNYTKANCVARGMYSTDSSARVTGRFTGIQWAPRNRESQSKSYVDGKTITVLSGRNDAIYNQSFPKIYGTQWVKPVVCNVLGDGNSTRFECVLCDDDIGSGGVNQVVVNGVIVPQYGDPLFIWRFVTTGTRNGAPNLDALYDGNGDPYGSLACIEVVVYRQLADSASVPSVRVLVRGVQVQKFLPIATVSGTLVTFTSGTPNTDCAGNPPFFVNIFGNSSSSANRTWTLTSWAGGPPGTITLSGSGGTGTGGFVQYKVRTTNPAWIIMDALIWSNWRYSDIDLASFSTEAIYCDGTVTYIDLTGASASHPRFSAELVLEQRKSAGEVIQALLRSCNGQITRNPVTGLLQFFIRKTLADQQPAPIAGSNYNTAVTSVTPLGGVANGYVAYLFDESSVSRGGPDDPPFVHTFADAGSSTPNKVSFGFQDRDNAYADDSITVIDVDAINRAGGYQGGQEIVEQLNVLGVSSFDQGVRISNTYLAERLRGNLHGDPRGTLYFELKTNFRPIHLRVGHIVFFSWQSLGISRQMCRVISIKPGQNWETSTVTLSWHEDVWYTDAYAQLPPPLFSDPRLGRPDRKPYPWQPYGERPIASDSIFGSVSGYVARSWWQMGISQAYTLFKDGTAQVESTIYGCLPVNSLSRGSSSTQPPLMSIQGSSLTTGGTIPGGIDVYVAIAAIDAAGLLTALSKVVKLSTVAGTSTNTVTTPVISWQDGTSGYVLYGGPSEFDLSEQDRDSTSPSTITISNLNFETYGPPDQLAAKLNIRSKRCGGGPGQGHSGVWGDLCSAVAANTLSFGPATTTNQFVGYDLMLVALPKFTNTPIPVANFRVTANDNAGNYTVTPNPMTALAGGTQIPVGSVFVMAFNPGATGAVITSTSISDPNLISAYALTGLNPGDEVGSILTIIAGKGKGHKYTIISNTSTAFTISEHWHVTPDSTTRYIIGEPNWADNIGSETIIVSDPNPSPAPVVAQFNLANYAGTTIFVQANIMDGEGNASLEAFAPFRVIYIWGDYGHPIQPVMQTGTSFTLSIHDR